MITGKELRYYNSKCKRCKNNFYYRHVALTGGNPVPFAKEATTATGRFRDLPTLPQRAGQF